MYKKRTVLLSEQECKTTILACGYRPQACEVGVHRVAARGTPHYCMHTCFVSRLTGRLCAWDLL